MWLVYSDGINEGWKTPEGTIPVTKEDSEKIHTNVLSELSTLSAQCQEGIKGTTLKPSLSNKLEYKLPKKAERTGISLPSLHNPLHSLNIWQNSLCCNGLDSFWLLAIICGYLSIFGNGFQHKFSTL